MDNWHQIQVTEVLKELDTTPERGLDDAEVQRRREQYGTNELVDRGSKSPWVILLEQVKGIMVIILLISAGVSFFIGEAKDAIVILAIVVINTILGFTQEYRAEKAMAALKQLATPRVRVRRGGHLVEIQAQELVPGDIVLLEAGNAIPADGRVIESVNLRVQEAVLTGESEAVEKETAPLHQENLSLGDRRNLVYMGTIVSYGRGTAVITNTGMETQLGKIANMLQSVGQEATPLQRRLEQLGRGLAVAALGIVALVFIFGLLRGEDLRLMISTSIGMAVAAVPEGLPTVVVVALALGAQRMLKRNALIRKLPAVETLGSVTVICSDKTGTLTENRMTVTVVDVAGHHLDLKERLRSFSPTVGLQDDPEEALVEKPSISLLLLGGSLCNDATLEPSETETGSFSAVGDPTEGALVIAAARAGLWKSKLEEVMPRVSELPFDSERKRMTTVHRVPTGSQSPELQDLVNKLPAVFDSEYVAFTKGAVDSLLTVASSVWSEDHLEPLDEGWKTRIMEANNRMAQNGMRVLGLAYRNRPTSQIDENKEPIENDLTIIGMFGMIDPARSEVKDAVQTSQLAGIRPVMITGDHPLTALYIARELGIATDKRSQILTGQDLDKITVEQLEEQVETIPVYARVSPEHKLKIVQALQDRGHVVAMTGDGVNDAPALKRADIGVAMGITGTDVSKEASDMVLLDDNFATIVAAVEEGRRIYDNIRKFIRYTMTSNAGEVWVMLLGPFLGMPLALLPLQILWVNLVTDGLPGLALTVEPTERNTMRRKPYPVNENIFGRGMARDILWVGLLMGLVSLLMGFFYYRSGHETWQTMVFTTLTLSQMGNVLSIRSESETIFSLGFGSNRLLLWAVLLTFGLQMAVVYVPFMQDIFSTVPLPLPDLLVSLALSTVVFFAAETVKVIRNRRRRAATA